MHSCSPKHVYYQTIKHMILAKHVYYQTLKHMILAKHVYYQTIKHMILAKHVYWKNSDIFLSESFEPLNGSLNVYCLCLVPCNCKLVNLFSPTHITL